MGKRAVSKRQKARNEIEAMGFLEEMGGKSRQEARLYAINGGWHPDDADKVRNPNTPRDQRYQKNVKPRSENQARLMKALETKSLVCALGPAGTGKTYLAICKAVEALQSGKVARIILSRPAVEAGSGEKPDSENATVVVHYTGTLLDGTKFDSSVDRGQPATFALNQVIPGWTEGLQLMKKGAKYRFYIPPELAYGSDARPGSPIGPNSTLIFDVELIDVNPNADKPKAE